MLLVEGMGDVERLASFLQVDQEAINSQQWAVLMPSILQRALEFEQLNSQNIVLEVSLEQANRNAEQRIASTTEELSAKALEIQELKSHPADHESARREQIQKIDALQKENHLLQERVQAVLIQNSDLSEDKRQALALVDRQSRATENCEEECKTLSKRYQELRKSTIELENQVHEARTQSSNAQVCPSFRHPEAILTW